MKQQIAVLGGDERQVYLSQLLSASGWNLRTWGLEKENAPGDALAELALTSDIIILPLPVCRGRMLNLPLADTELLIEKLFSYLREEQLILGGMIRSIPQEVRDAYPFDVMDYYSREDVQMMNAIPTAEGAIMHAIAETKVTIFGSRCLVVGFGRIGKMLSHRLKALGADVTISARKVGDIAQAKAYGYRAVPTEGLGVERLEFDVIFNTVPAIIFDPEKIKQIDRCCLLVELASDPGGFDMYSVKGNNFKYIDAKGLPGKIAPFSSAKTICDSVCQILKERGYVL